MGYLLVAWIRSPDCRAEQSQARLFQCFHFPDAVHNSNFVPLTSSTENWYDDTHGGSLRIIVPIEQFTQRVCLPTEETESNWLFFSDSLSLHLGILVFLINFHKKVVGLLRDKFVIFPQTTSTLEKSKSLIKYCLLITIIRLLNTKKDWHTV